MTQAHDFWVDGFHLTGVDAFGVDWTVTEAPGWHDAPPMRSDRQPKVGQAGSWPSQGQPGERIVTLRGTAVSADLPSLEAAGSRLATVLATCGAGDLIGSSVYGIRSMVVSLEDSPKFAPSTDRIASWQITVVATDPLKYGTPTYGTATLAASTPGAGRVWPRVYPTDYGIAPGVVPGAVPVANAGTAAYWPRLRIDGPVTNPVVSLAESGAWVRYGGSLVLGQWLDIDCANRTVLLQGSVSMRQKVTSYGDWLAISPGGGSIAWTADTADSAALLTVYACEGAWS